jgi:hypothetical protein
MDRLYAFWQTDRPPYLQGGEVIHISGDKVGVRERTGLFVPAKVVPLKQGIKLQKKLHKAELKYKRAKDNLRHVGRIICS